MRIYATFFKVKKCLKKNNAVKHGVFKRQKTLFY
jgi:hypothetical protein